MTLLGASLLFVVGVGIGVSGQETVVETITSTQTELSTVTDTVTTTVVRTVKARPPAAPNQQEIAVDYGQWPGLFQLSGLRLVSEGYGFHSVVGTFEYVGGGDCKLGYLEFNATLYKDGQVIDTALWNDVDNPKAGVRYPFEMSLSESRPDRVEIVMTDASCA